VTVVEVGPVDVRGPNSADAELVSAGLDAIDDELTLVDDRAVLVADVWHSIMSAVLGGCSGPMVLVFPTWWSSSRVERVHAAARTVTPDVTVLRRADVLTGEVALVEVTPEFAVMSAPGVDLRVVTRDDLDTLAVSRPILVDGVDASVWADRLREKGFTVTIADDDWARRGVEALRFEDESPRPRRTVRGAMAVMAGTLVAAAVVCGAVVVRDEQSSPAVPMTLLVEGRVGVMVPARWVVERVTEGPGSARVQVVSPDDTSVALHVTQSAWPSGSLEQAARSLSAALSQEPDGVFVDFTASDRRAGRPVVSYREQRAGRDIVWAVFVDKSVRIAIGCQSGRGREESVRVACEQAIRSAHAVS
jgi:type VII secretion-associated protein (TIGR03931 family)